MMAAEKIQVVKNLPWPLCGTKKETKKEEVEDPLGSSFKESLLQIFLLFTRAANETVKRRRPISLR